MEALTAIAGIMQGQGAAGVVIAILIAVIVWLVRRIDRKFDDVGKRFDDVIKRFDEGGKRMGAIERNLVEHCGSLKLIQERVSHNSDRGKAITDRLEKFIDQNQQEHKALDDKFSASVEKVYNLLLKDK